MSQHRRTPPPAVNETAESLGEIETALRTNSGSGLTNEDARRRLADYGPNEPAPIEEPRWWRLLARQFESKLILILVAATVVSLLLGEWLNAVAIGVTVVASALFGFANELRSEKSISALRGLTARSAEVIRGGLHEEVPASEVVPGDLVVLTEGRTVPSDARIVETRGLLVNESIFTGEPVAVAKATEPGGLDKSVIDQRIVRAGTTVVAGSGVALTVATGAETALGGIFASLSATKRDPTPLERRLDRLGNRLILVFLALCALVSVIGLAQGRSPSTVFELAVSLAVGAVPEGLPAVATTALALAVRRLAQSNVLVRRLDAVETLGSTTVIATDKTGTLTENRQVVRSVILRSGQVVDARVSTGPDGASTTGLVPAADQAASTEDLEVAKKVLITAAMCSDAIVEQDLEHGWHVHGDPSEGACAVAAAGLGYDTERLAAQFPRLSTVPFTSTSRSMTTVHEDRGLRLTAMKGAPERVLAVTGVGDPALSERIATCSTLGYRLLGVASGPAEDTLEFLGIIVLEDPLRADAVGAVRACQELGIALVLITGDQLRTAENVARETGILSGHLRAVVAADLGDGPVDDVAVVARASHEDKRRFVQRLKAGGAIVAMTGDGVNDAPALRSADVGVAVGPNATDVATEAAQVVLSDGRLSSLADGIREGRQVVANLRAAIIYLLVASFATIMTIAVALAFTDGVPLAALQILWLNLVVHLFPAFALATGRERQLSMLLPSGELLGTRTWLEVAFRASCAAAAGVAAAAIGAANDDSVLHDQSFVFVTLGMALVGQAFLIGVWSIREQVSRIARRGLWLACLLSVGLALVALYVPGLNGLLGLTSPSAAEWAIAGGLIAASWCAAQVGVVALRPRRQGAIQSS